MKNIRIFYQKIFIFMVVKFSVYLNRHGFLMIMRDSFSDITGFIFLLLTLSVLAAC